MWWLGHLAYQVCPAPALPRAPAGLWVLYAAGRRGAPVLRLLQQQRQQARRRRRPDPLRRSPLRALSARSLAWSAAVT